MLGIKKTWSSHLSQPDSQAGSRVVLASHFFTSGPANELEHYLQSHVSSLLTIFHPFPDSYLQHDMITRFKNGSIESRRWFAKSRRLQPVQYLRDLAISTILPITEEGRVDTYIGSNPINALAGLIVKKLGFARRVIFYKIDYVPNRFSNRVMNHVYHAIDDKCSRDCDWTWNLSSVMIDQRKSRIGEDRFHKQVVVPIGANFERIVRLPPEETFRHRLVYMGSLRPNQGIELAIRAFPKIKEIFPDAELLIIGSGPMEKELRNIVRDLGLDNVTFTGQIPDHAIVEGMLSKCGVGIAAYEPSRNSYTQYTEPGKVKVYLACGLPVIITRVPKIAADIEAKGAGVIIDFSVDSFVDGITRLFQDQHVYASARKSAIDFAAQFSWTRIFDDTFEKILR